MIQRFSASRLYGLATSVDGSFRLDRWSTPLNQCRLFEAQRQWRSPCCADILQVAPMTAFSASRRFRGWPQDPSSRHWPVRCRPGRPCLLLVSAIRCVKAVSGVPLSVEVKRKLCPNALTLKREMPSPFRDSTSGVRSMQERHALRRDVAPATLP